MISFWWLLMIPLVCFQGVYLTHCYYTGKMNALIKNWKNEQREIEKLAYYTGFEAGVNDEKRRYQIAARYQNVDGKYEKRS